MKEDIEKRKGIFKIVRDIPYYISTGKEQDYSCATKPLILKTLLESLGLKLRRIICEFRWEKLNLPKELLELPHDEVDTHEYLEVYVPEKEKWVKVDPNWDSWQRFFPVAEWDGISDTIIAVTPEKTYSPEDSMKIIKEEDEVSPQVRKDYLEKNKKFFQALNKWLQYQRTY